MLHLLSRWHIIAVATIVILLSVAQLMRFYGNDIDVLSFASSRLNDPSKSSSNDSPPPAEHVQDATLSHSAWPGPVTVTHYAPPTTVTHTKTETETIASVVETPASPKGDNDDKKDRPADKAKSMKPLADVNTTIHVPKDIHYDPKGPRPDQVILLTAADGKGHNGGIENIIGQAAENRKAYCQHHGYNYHFVNISKFDLGDAHPVWKKLPAILDAFAAYPDAHWLFFLDLDAIIMTPKQDLNSLLLSHDGMRRSMDPGVELHGGLGNPLGVWWPRDPDPANIDLIIAQDHNGLNAGSFFLRRSEWTQWLIDLWADPFFMTAGWEAEEQDALVHLVRHHPSVRAHTGLAKQRTFNSFVEGPESMNWVEGDLLVHLAGCWVVDKCAERWYTFWENRGTLP